MSKSGNITSFFKPIPRPSQSAQPSTSAPETSPTPPPPKPSAPSPPSLRSPSPLPALSSSSSPEPPPTVRDRNAVIPGSDDEDDDDFSSDDDVFPALFSKPSASTLPLQTPSKDRGRISATPQAKRRALEFHSSPLTINTKHRFDIEALLKHAEADNAIEESEQRTAALLAQGSPTRRGGGLADGAPASLHDAMLEVLPGAEDSQDECNRGRLLRAVKRTEATVRPKEWCFFDRQSQANSTSIEVRAAFPKSKATGFWAFLAPDKHRSEVFQDGLPFHVQSKMRNLPDEIFEWVLNEASREKSKKLRDEYVRLLGACPDQAGRVMDEDLIADLFRDIGASERALEAAASSQPDGGSGQGGLSPEHDWTGLRTVLRILAETAHALKISALTRAMAILLRLGMDNLVREDHAVAIDHQDALLRIALAVPSRAWDTFVRNQQAPLPSNCPGSPD